MKVLLIFMLIAFVAIFAIWFIRYLSAFDWKAIFKDFDIKRLIGRFYFWIMFLLAVLLNVIVLACYNFRFNFADFGFLILFGLCALLTLWALIKLGSSLVYGAKSKIWQENITDFMERVVTFSGVPRCGKTSSSIYTAILLAKKSWKELRRAYWQIMRLPFEELEEKVRENKDEIIRAYTFFQKHQKTHIPCLYSFCTIYRRGRTSHKLTKKMLLQKEPLMFSSVIVVDEISSLFPNQNQMKASDKKENFLKVADFGKYIGQYIDGYMLFTEQNFGNAFKNLRDVCGLDLHYPRSQKWVCKPTFLLAIYNGLFSFFEYTFWEMEHLKPESKAFYRAEKGLFRSSKIFGPFMRFLADVIKNVGFRKYTYELQNNQNGQEKQVLGSGNFYLPAPLNAKYNDRYFRNKYECINASTGPPAQSEDFFPSAKEIESQLLDD